MQNAMFSPARPFGTDGPPECTIELAGPKTHYFFRLWLDRRLAAWRNDVLQPHVGDQVAVVFHVVHVVDSQYVQFRCVVSEELQPFE